MIMQQHKSFSINLATFALTSLRLPDTLGFRNWLQPPEPTSEDTLTDLPDERGVDDTDDDAGMGKIRMTLVRLGCRVNLDAPNTVSCMLSSLTGLSVQVCAIGALVHYIKRSVTAGDRRILDINGIESMSLSVISASIQGSEHEVDPDSNQHMVINQDALA